MTKKLAIRAHRARENEVPGSGIRFDFTPRFDVLLAALRADVETELARLRAQEGGTP